jgi:ParB/RepB/Spo0J family partition protein
MKLPLSNIFIPERQRTDLGDIDKLAASLRAVGQAQPILVTKVDDHYDLIAGCRRLTAAAKLGWTEIECYVRESLTPLECQLLELEEDIRRKDRTWQERCLAIYKIHYMKKAEHDFEWTMNQTAEFTGDSQASISYMLSLAKHLQAEPEFFKDCTGYYDAIKKLAMRNSSEVQAERERRRQAQVTVGEFFPSEEHAPVMSEEGDTEQPSEDNVELNEVPLDLPGRVFRYNATYSSTPPLVMHNGFIYGYWFLGGGNISDFYGSYSTVYLERIQSLFPDAKRVLHLFSGSMPPGAYVRVGCDPTGKYKSDIEGNAEQLSSFLPFKPDLIYADPPYSEEDSEHYKHAMVNRAKVVDECATVLQPGGFLVWLDQALPVFSNEHIRYVGCISYIRSTGNRFRCVCLFQKPL